MFSTTSNRIVLPVALSVECDLVTDKDGYFFVQFEVSTDDNEDDSQLISIPFSEITENLLAFYREEYGVDRYKDLYSIAHELSRESEKIREAATKMEDSLNHVSDLFTKDRSD